ncbi:MAG TPA: methylated-DNA--[protein]-cysteine S-methyltransferase [Streptosporangiaceae bacterium]|nr:methylated-DNA--[protein]-cysteine S-methyltransferase [Streptosporangiaceae bacterium]
MMTTNSTNSNHDPLLTELAGLTAAPPAGLLDRVVARWVRVPGPIGDLSVAFTDQGIAYVRLDDADSADSADSGAPTGFADPSAPTGFADDFRRRFARPLLPADRPPAGLVPALRSGKTNDLKFDLRGLTAFQTDVLRAARTIPKGQIRPYAWIAEQIGRPKAVRAVGSALAHNPVPVLIPCHRVTRSDGAVGEYVFGSSAKERLLRAENVDLDEIRSLAGRHVFYIGSDTTGVVCFPTCHNARRITPGHRHGFRTLTEAERAGYRPCRSCRPGVPRPA